MPVRQTISGITVLGLLALAACGARQPAGPELPTVDVHTKKGSISALFAPHKKGDTKRWVKAQYRDLDGVLRSGKVALRGFSGWHHGRTKPSIRINPKGSGYQGSNFVELSRPEDPLAVCNWLPDQLGASLGLMHEHSEAVHLRFNFRNMGVYLRSVRPGDDLCAAEGRTSGTFFKGDCLGERRKLDLWSGSSAWQVIGKGKAKAIPVLDEMLAALRQPASADSFSRLQRVLDLERMASVSAVATLVGSIHADAVHNHVLFFDHDKQQLEPLLWDANGFGIHAEPELAVEVARHPLAARLLCFPEYLHRRNQVLWKLLHGEGSAQRLVAAVDERLAKLDSVLQSDPEIARLVLRRGVFEAVALDYRELPAARAEFVQFVQRRETHLTKWFGNARVAWSPLPEDPEQTVVTVHGTVAIKLSRRDGGVVRSDDGHDASLLWPGIGEQLVDVRQLQHADGRGVSAPHGVAAPMHYVVACPAEQLLAHNAFTDEEVLPSAMPPADSLTRSLHPWQHVSTPASPR